MLTEIQSLSSLRARAWAGVPKSPGVYWWYFPPHVLELFRLSEFSQLSALRLRQAPDGKVCLYHGMANDLAERVKWHAAQKLRVNSLQSGFLSTFRLSLLALNDFAYLQDATHIDKFFDELSICWTVSRTREEAEAIERRELESQYHYPLNIQRNRRPELREFVRHLKDTRRDYKKRFLSQTASPL